MFAKSSAIYFWKVTSWVRVTHRARGSFAEPEKDLSKQNSYSAKQNSEFDRGTEIAIIIFKMSALRIALEEEEEELSDMLEFSMTKECTGVHNFIEKNVNCKFIESSKIRFAHVHLFQAKFICWLEWIGSLGFSELLHAWNALSCSLCLPLIIRPLSYTLCHFGIIWIFPATSYPRENWTHCRQSRGSIPGIPKQTIAPLLSLHPLSSLCSCIDKLQLTLLQLLAR